MGRKTFESLPFLLPELGTLKITKIKALAHRKGYVYFLHSEAVVKAAKEIDIAYVIGGAINLRKPLPYVDVMYITERLYI